MSTTHRTVVVLGGGYAGVLCANRLRASLTDAEADRTRIRLVNPTDRFWDRIRLHELAAGSRADASVPLAEVLHPDVELVVGTADRIDPTGRAVLLAGTGTGTGTGTVAATGAGRATGATWPTGRTGPAGAARAIPYDLLVLAVGSEPRLDVPGAREHTHPIGSSAGATAARAALAAAPPGARVAVVGGGATGVETAAEVAERHPHADVVLLAAGPLLPGMRPAARRSVTRRLRRLGVTVREGVHVDRVDPGQLRTDAADVPFDVALWAASFRAPDLAARSGLAVDDGGRLRVDAALRSVDSAAILGAGDAVRLPDDVGAHLRMGCASALPLGGAAAATALALLRGNEPPPASVGFALQCLSLGRHAGYVQVVRPDDTPRRLAVHGRAGAAVKEAICRMAAAAPGKEAVRPGAYRSPAGPPDAAARTARRAPGGTGRAATTSAGA
jgi:NADH:ubiquinone reductase (H+-translocating)